MTIYIFNPEDGGSMFLRNVGKEPEDYTAQEPTLLWKPQILHNDLPYEFASSNETGNKKSLGRRSNLSLPPNLILADIKEECKLCTRYFAHIFPIGYAFMLFCPK
jgi:hypothetical protein